MTIYSTDHPIRALNDHTCFGCGKLNPVGLHLAFFRLADGDGVWAPWTPDPAYEGYGGMIHGGIICTLMDEILAWSLYAQETWAVTARLNTTFRAPVRVGEPVRLVGRVVRDRGRVIELHGELRREADDTLLAEADAVFMRVPPAQAERWNQQYQMVGE